MIRDLSYYTWYILPSIFHFSGKDSPMEDPLAALDEQLKDSNIDWDWNDNDARDLLKEDESFEKPKKEDIGKQLPHLDEIVEE